ncbi:MAG: hypothetical protein GEV05_26655 [Betaproteobacteria bacterium]|nr:hypothetical protein [Betaproteobacteria bacterium]
MDMTGGVSSNGAIADATGCKRMTQFPSLVNEATARQGVPWSTLWRGGLLAFCIILAFSTQLLFQVALYANWPLSAILHGWMDHLLDQLIVGGCIFACVALGSLVPMNTTLGMHGCILASIALGAVAGEALLMLRLPLAPDVSVAAVLFAKSARWMTIGALAYAFFIFQRQSAQVAAQLHHSELQRVQIDLQMTQARLQSLHAYVEPHFLFNTLANVHQLFRSDPERGRAMLANFIAYVRAVLPQMRHDQTTLKQDVELARAYLGVLQVRMGARLQVHFDVPDDLAALAFPPLALSTLTENAIKHGLNPLPEGGTITITARLADGQLIVGVADTGVGLRSESGTGGGLANLRARLATLYGDAARLDLQANVPRGMSATISIPTKASTAEIA